MGWDLMPIPVCAEYISKRVAGAKVSAVQEPGAIEAICSLLLEVRPEVIVEFGTCSGGLTMPMHETLPEADLFSFDIKNDMDPAAELITLEWNPTKRDWFGPTVRFIRANLLIGEDLEVRAALSTGRRTLLYCDNGHKALEVRTWAPLLRSGDILGAHDWNEEISETDIADILTDFAPLHHQEFEAQRLLSRFWIRK